MRTPTQKQNDIPTHILVSFLFVVVLMPFASAGVISAIESNIGGIIVTLFGFGLLTATVGYGFGGFKTGLVGAFAFIVGLGMIGGVSFWNSFKELWNMLK